MGLDSLIAWSPSHSQSQTHEHMSDEPPNARSVAASNPRPLASYQALRWRNPEQVKVIQYLR